MNALSGLVINGITEANLRVPGFREIIQAFEYMPVKKHIPRRNGSNVFAPGLPRGAQQIPNSAHIGFIFYNTVIGKPAAVQKRGSFTEMIFPGAVIGENNLKVNILLHSGAEQGSLQLTPVGVIGAQDHRNRKIGYFRHRKSPYPGHPENGCPFILQKTPGQRYTVLV